MFGYSDSSSSMAVDVVEGFHDFGVNFGQCVEQREAKVAQAHADFIVDCRLCQPDLVGLPQARSLPRGSCFQNLGLFGVSGRRSRRSSCCAMRRRFSRTVWRATSVGCAVNTGVIAIWPSAASGILLPRFQRLSCAEAFREMSREAERVHGPVCPRDAGVCDGWSRRDWSVRNKSRRPW